MATVYLLHTWWVRSHKPTNKQMWKAISGLVVCTLCEWPAGVAKLISISVIIICTCCACSLDFTWPLWSLVLTAVFLLHCCSWSSRTFATKWRRRCSVPHVIAFSMLGLATSCWRTPTLWHSLTCSRRGSRPGGAVEAWKGTGTPNHAH